MKPLRGVSLWGPLGGSSWEATATCSRPRESLEMYSFENLFSFLLFFSIPRTSEVDGYRAGEEAELGR